MHRKTDTLSAALFGLKEGKSAPFSKEIVKIDDNVSIIQKQNGNKTVSIPMYPHLFRFITPKKVSEAQKFALQFPTADSITGVADKLRYHRHKKGLYQSDVADYLGIERGTYSEYENNSRDYYAPEMMDKLTNLFEVNVYDLLDDYNRFIYDGQAQYIKNLRKQLGITQKELAKMMNTELYNIKKWEQGKVRMFKCTWKNMQNCLKVWYN